MKHKKKEMSMYMGGGKMMKGMMDYAMGGKMDKEMMKMYASGGMLKALLKDPKQREMAKKMLGSMEKGGMMYGEKGMKVKKYQEGGMNATGETRKKRPLEGASFEEKRAANRAEMAKATKRRLSSPTRAMTAYSLIMAGLPRAESKQQGEANINIAKMTAEKGVEGLLDYFKSDDWGGKVPPREKVEQFVEKFGK